MLARPLGTCQADGLEQLAKSDLERVPAGWIVVTHPVMPIITNQTVRSLGDRGLCRIIWHRGRETARISSAGRKAWREIEAARFRVHSAA